MTGRSFAFLGFASLVACAAPAPGERETSEVKVAEEVPKDLKALFDKANFCSGSGDGSIGRFDVATFDADEVKAALQAEDKAGVDCSDRDYASSSADAAKMFKQALGEELCIGENVSSGDRKKLEALFTDASNLGVFASAYSGGDNPEACSFYRYVVYRKDGVTIEFRFDRTKS